MLQDVPAFSGFSVNDQEAAKEFYGQTLGLTVEDNGMGLKVNLANSAYVFIYAKADHTPATFTVLNFQVTDIDAAVTELASKGIVFEHYDNPAMPQDETGVLRGKSANMGPDIAWFTDPAGNILSILQN